MLSKTYFKYLIKLNYKKNLIFTIILCFLIGLVMFIFNPEMVQNINETSGDLSFNPLGDISSLIKFISSQYYGMMALILPMIFSIYMGNQLIAQKVDTGQMAYALATPTSRKQISTTSALFLISSLIVMFASIALTGVVVAEIVQPGELEIGVFLKLTVGALLLQLAISGIVFLASCSFNTTSKSLMFGAGIPVLFFIINLLIGMSQDLDFLRMISLFELYDANAIIDGGHYIVRLFVLAIISLITYASGMIYFNQRDLPL